MQLNFWTGILVGLLPTFVPLIPYLHGKRLEQKEKRFTYYHQLIKELVDKENGQDKKIDRQIAVIFELKYFKKYFPVTKRILIGLKNDWGAINSDPNHQGYRKLDRLIAEIDITLNHIEGS